MSEVVVKYYVHRWENRHGMYDIQEIRVVRETEASYWFEGQRGPRRKSSLAGSIHDTPEQALACVKARRARVAERFDSQAAYYENMAAEARKAAEKQRARIAANPEPTWEQCFVDKPYF